MALNILGINHRTAPVEIREQVAFGPQHLGGALRELVGMSEVKEALIVSTCNRTELYGRFMRDDDAPARDWLMGYHQLPAATTDCLYTFRDERAIGHTFVVGGGLDSAVLGEPQILGQMKEAYRAACDAGTTGPVLNGLFQQAFSVAKQVRTDTAIGASAVSVAYAAVSLARQIFASFDKHTALLIGAGETVELTARHLHSRGLNRMIIANRSIERARSLAQRYQGFAIGLDEIPSHLADADMIVAATASPEPLLSEVEMKVALKLRRNRPVFIADLAVPRDVEASVSKLSDVYLYTVDDLQNVIRENLASRREAARQAQQIIEAEVARFSRSLRARDVAPVIRAVRDQAVVIRDDVMGQAQRLLEKGRSPEDVIRFLGNTLTNKLLHPPSTGLRRAGERGDEDLLRAARHLFDLDKD